MTWNTDNNIWGTDCNIWSLMQIDCGIIVGFCQWVGENNKWSECKLPPSICAKWGTQNIWWKNENLIWSHCLPFVPPIPPQPPFQMPPGIDATTIIQPWQAEEQWNPYRAGEFNKRKRCIKLVCKVQGKLFEEEKEAGDMEISVDGVKMMIKTISDAELKIM